MQRPLSKSSFLSCLIVAAPVLALHALWRAQPNRASRADAVVAGRAVAVPAARRGEGAEPAMQLWRLEADEPRFGGVSGLAVDRGELVALTDSGVVVRFAAPARARQRVEFAFHDLPAGPGSASRKRGRDSEALVADRDYASWWVVFEGRHSLWRFDRAFRRALERHPLETEWRSNKGGEALVVLPDGAMAVLPEKGGRAVRVRGHKAIALDAPRGTSDATRLSDGRLVLLVRRLTPLGFRSEVRIAASATRPAVTIALPLAPLDNPEAIAAAPLRGGATRLWIATDDNFRPYMRTLLMSFDLL